MYIQCIYMYMCIPLMRDLSAFGNVSIYNVRDIVTTSSWESCMYHSPEYKREMSFVVSCTECTCTFAGIYIVSQSLGCVVLTILVSLLWKQYSHSLHGT